MFVAALSLVVAGCSGTEAQRPASSLKVIPHEELAKFLPVLGGWEQERAPQGDTDSAEGYSRVQVNYAQTGGIGGLSVEIVDTTKSVDVLGPLLEFIKADKVDKIGDPTAPVTVTPMKVKGYPAKQEWQPHEGANNGSLAILLADRFNVTITGNSLADAKVMTWAAEQIALDKLAALK